MLTGGVGYAQRKIRKKGTALENFLGNLGQNKRFLLGWKVGPFGGKKR